MTDAEEKERLRYLQLKAKKAASEATVQNENQDENVIEGLPVSLPTQARFSFGNIPGIKAYLKENNLGEDARFGPDLLLQIKKDGQWYTDTRGPGATDIGPALPAIGGAIGGGLGGAAGVAETLFSGGTLAPALVGQAVLGTTAGTGMGVTARRSIGGLLGVTRDESVGEVAKDIAKETAVNIVSEMLGPYARRAVSRFGVPAVAKFIASQSGIPASSIEFALRNPKPFLRGASKGINTALKEAENAPGSMGMLDEFLNKNSNDASVGAVKDIVNPVTNKAESPVFSPAYTPDPTKKVVGSVPGYSIEGSMPPIVPTEEQLAAQGLAEDVIPDRQFYAEGSSSGSPIRQAPSPNKIPAEQITETILGDQVKPQVVGERTVEQRLRDIDPITGFPRNPITQKNMYKMYTDLLPFANYNKEEPGLSSLAKGARKIIKDQFPLDLQGALTAHAFDSQEGGSLLGPFKNPVMRNILGIGTSAYSHSLAPAVATAAHTILFNPSVLKKTVPALGYTVPKLGSLLQRGVISPYLIMNMERGQ